MMRSFWMYGPYGWRFYCDSQTKFPNGEIADFAVWKRQLTRKEIEALCKGARPHDVAPQKLLKWNPLDRMK